MGMLKLPKSLYKALFPGSKKKSSSSSSTSTTASIVPSASSTGGKRPILPPPPPRSIPSKRSPPASKAASGSSGRDGGSTYEEFLDAITDPIVLKNLNDAAAIINNNAAANTEQRQRPSGTESSPVTVATDLASMSDLNRKIFEAQVQQAAGGPGEFSNYNEGEASSSSTTALDTALAPPSNPCTPLGSPSRNAGFNDSPDRSAVEGNVNDDDATTNNNSSSSSRRRLADDDDDTNSPVAMASSSARSVTPEPEDAMAGEPSSSSSSAFVSTGSSEDEAATMTTTMTIKPRAISIESEEQALKESNSSGRGKPQATADASAAADRDGAAARKKASSASTPPITKSSSSKAKKVQFSVRGEEARQRAIARQKKILSKASLRLGAISDTSLRHIEEVTAAAAATKKEADANKKKDAAAAASSSEPKESYSPDDFLAASPERPGTADTEAAVAAATVFIKGGGNRDTAEQQTKLESASESPNNARVVRGSKVFEVGKSNFLPAQQRRVVVTVDVDEAGPAKALFPEADHNSGKVQGDESAPENQNIQFFILLLCPTSRIFELIEISARDTSNNDSTVADVLKLIPQKCTDKRLLDKEYVGLVRPSDRVDFMDRGAKAFEAKKKLLLEGKNGEGKGQEKLLLQRKQSQEEWQEQLHKLGEQHQQQPNNDGGQEKSQNDSWGEGDILTNLQHFIREDDVLVATLDGYSGYQMSKISKPILRNSKFRDMIRRRSHKGNARGCKLSRTANGGGDSVSYRSGKSGRSMRSNKSGRSRRRKQKTGSGSVSSSRSSRRIVSAVPEEVCCDDDDDKKRSSNIMDEHGSENEKYSSLCQKLEHLSKKLHDVDDEIIAGDASVSGASIASFAIPEDMATDTVLECVNEDEEVLPEISANPSSSESNNNNFKMTPQMVAYELAANIEDIFAGHDVEIVAVDGDVEDDSDDDTFVSARSSRSMKSMKSVRSIMHNFDAAHAQNNKTSSAGDNNNNNKPLFEITTKKKPPRKPRKSKFDTFGEDDMMLQIEAMAAQADMAFESHKKNRTRNNDDGSVSVVKHHSVIIEPVIESAIIQQPPMMIDFIEEVEDKIEGVVDGIEVNVNGTATQNVTTADQDNQAKEDVALQGSSSAEEEINVSPTPEEIISALKSNMSSTEDASSSTTTVNTSTLSPFNITMSSPDSSNSHHHQLNNNDNTNSSLSSRTFLNTSTSMVSTMVAASQGRVNEVHVLQYLGVTIVCIAANMMQQRVDANGIGPKRSPGFGAKEVFQSAMFLAFMVNGQRYLAKVTKK